MRGRLLRGCKGYPLTQPLPHRASKSRLDRGEGTQIVPLQNSGAGQRPTRSLHSSALAAASPRPQTISTVGLKETPTMIRSLFVAGVLAGALLCGSSAEACWRCKREPCAPTCCAVTCRRPVTCCTTVYRTRIECVPVTTRRCVSYRDACGCCRTKVVCCTQYVRRCVRVPVHVCTTRRVPVCTATPAPCCDPCCGGSSCLLGLRGLLCCR